MDINAYNTARLNIQRAVARVEAAHPGCPFIATLHANLAAGDAMLVADVPGLTPLDGDPKPPAK